MARQYDGLSVDKYEARFTGPFELTDGEAEKCGLDRIVVFVVMGRVDSKMPKVMDTGDLNLKHVVKVTDVVLLEGDLREDALTFIAHGGDGRLDMSVHRNESEPVLLPSVQTADENGEMMSVGFVDGATNTFVEDDDDWLPPEDDEPVVERISLTDYKDPEAPSRTPGGGSGPKVAKFNPDEGGPVSDVGSVSVLGSVYPEKHTGKDKILAKALETWEEG